MSVENRNTVDFVAIDKLGRVVLTISDHLDWSKELEHLYLLQDKIDAYLSFIESGELLQEYPDADGRTPVIEIIAKFNPPDNAKTTQEFFRHVTELLKKSGIQFQAQTLPDLYRQESQITH